MSKKTRINQHSTTLRDLLIFLLIPPSSPLSEEKTVEIMQNALRKNHIHTIGYEELQIIYRVLLPFMHLPNPLEGS